MKNKGFTLIELLAVIVILAIIALIAIPIILNIIEETRESANKRNIEMYGKAVENAIADYLLVNPTAQNITYSDIKEYIEYDGEEIACDTIEINRNRNIYLSDCKIGDTNIEYSYGVSLDNNSNIVFNDGDVVYFDVLNDYACTKEEYEESYGQIYYDEIDGMWKHYVPSQGKMEDVEVKYAYENSIPGYNGLNGTENQNSCLRFYVFNDDGGEYVSLMLDHVIYMDFSEYDEPITVIDNLNKAVPWTFPDRPTNYTYVNEESNISYTIDYSNYFIRLITAEEVANITNNTFDNKQIIICNGIDNCKYNWLLGEETHFTITRGYEADYTYWYISNDLGLTSSTVGGFRPVVDVEKNYVLDL